MKKLLLITILCSFAFAYDFYVSPDGSDAAGLGTTDMPVASIGKAVELAQKIIELHGYPTEGIAINISGGQYTIRDTIKLGAEFNGTKDAPIIVRAVEGESVHLIGGVSMKMSDFEPVADEAVLSRLPQEARGKVVGANMRSLGVTDYGTLPLYGHSMGFLDKVTDYKSGVLMPELFFNGTPMTLARWPNGEYAKIKSVVEVGSRPRTWMPDLEGNTQAYGLGLSYVPPQQRDNPPKGFAFTIDSDRPANWANAEDAWMYGFWYWNWSDQSVQVESIDIAKGIIKSVQPSAYGIQQGQHFYIYNLIEELDEPGEWYLNRTTGILYFYPPSPDKGAKVHLSLFEGAVIRLERSSHVRIEGLTIEVSRGNAVEMSGGTFNSIRNCTIRNIAGNAVSIEGGTQNGVADCTIHGIGSSGIILNGGDRRKLVSAGHYAENNHIYDFSRIVQTYSPAVDLIGVGNRAAHNKIHDAPHTALRFNGNDHLIEYNEIFNVMNNATDMGAIYAGRSHTMWGNKIRNNYFHNIETRIDKGHNSGHSRLVHAIYLDDTISGIEVSGNVFYKVKEAMVASGSDITFTNNIIIDSKSGVWWKSRKDWQSDYGQYQSQQQRQEMLRRNTTIAADIKATPYNSDVWVRRYPNLVTSIEKTYGPQRCVVANNVLVNTPRADGVGMSHLESTIFKDNMYLNEAILKTGIVENNLVIRPDAAFVRWVREKLPDVYNPKYYTGEIDDEMVIQGDPGFVDYEGGNFRLKDSSLVFEKIPDFKPIPCEKIGLRNN